MRGAGFEPINVISNYKYQDNLGYYEETKDISQNFFFDYIPKGTHIFEYPIVAFNSGDFSAGITTIQCMYAPEFSSHSEGKRVNIDPCYGFLRDDLPRHDKRLVEVVEKLGEKANRKSSKLEVVEIDSPMYRIDQYDGKERVETPDSVDWVVIKD